MQFKNFFPYTPTSSSFYNTSYLHIPKCTNILKIQRYTELELTCQFFPNTTTQQAMSYQMHQHSAYSRLKLNYQQKHESINTINNFELKFKFEIKNQVSLTYTVVSCPPPCVPVLTKNPAGTPASFCSFHSSPVESKKAFI